MCLCQWDIHKPNATASLVTLQVGVVVVQEGEDGGNEDGNSLLI
jgi:hypothetical protein